MKSRRLIVCPKFERSNELAPSYCRLEAKDMAPYQVELAMSALGQKRTSAVQTGMSALLPKADMCGAARDVRYGPKADTSARLLTSPARRGHSPSAIDCSLTRRI